jgi:tRNA(Ile)-lysidine synthase
VTVPQPRLAVAVSGGHDSTALLHCTLRQARPLGIEVWALHVHHGLMPQADAWLQQVQSQARRWGARFDCRRLQGQPARGDSVEAWARAGRYEALAEMAREHGCNLVLLAHHRLDQAETFLLQALRGAGVAGLSAMPTAAQRQGLVWARPWLDTDPQAIASYVRRQRLQHVQDPSNADPAFLRSRLRQQLWPTLAAAFPQTQAALAASAGHAQEAHSLAMEVAAIDLQGIASGHGMRLSAWRQLSPARQRTAPQALAWPAPGGQLRRHRGSLCWVPDDAVTPEREPPPAACLMDLSRPGRFPQPDAAGVWHVSRARSGGLAAADLQAVQGRARQGGERFRLRPDAPSRSLKQQFQAAGVPPWQRQAPLLLHADGRLLFVPGLGVEGRSQAPEGTAQLRLRWEPAAPPATGQRQRPG